MTATTSSPEPMHPSAPRSLSAGICFAACLALPRAATAQAAISGDTSTVIAITPPRSPLPPEAASRGITKFSFIAYGDTRGAFDGTQLQYEHSLVMSSMLRTIAARANSADPIRFVVQSGDGNATTPGDTARTPGLRNYLGANAKLIPRPALEEIRTITSSCTSTAPRSTSK